MNAVEGLGKRKTALSMTVGVMEVSGTLFQEGRGHESLPMAAGGENQGLEDKEVVMVNLYNSLEKFFSERKHGKGSGAGGGCGVREHGGFGRRGALEEMGEDSGDEWWCWPLTVRGTLSAGCRKVRQSVCAWWLSQLVERAGGW